MAKKIKKPKKLKPKNKLKFTIECKYKEKYNRKIRKKIYRCIWACLQKGGDLDDEQVIKEIRDCIDKCLKENLTPEEATEVGDEPFPFVHIE